VLRAPRTVDDGRVGVDERGAGKRLEDLPARERDVEALLRDARVLAGDLLRARAVTRLDRVDEGVVLMLRDEQDLALRHLRV
jgi:hypothetical protein